MSKAVKEMAMKYYPKLWDEDRLKAGKLTETEYKSVAGKAYTE